MSPNRNRFVVFVTNCNRFVVFVTNRRHVFLEVVVPLGQEGNVLVSVVFSNISTLLVVNPHEKKHKDTMRSGIGTNCVDHVQRLVRYPQRRVVQPNCVKTAREQDGNEEN